MDEVMLVAPLAMFSIPWSITLAAACVFIYLMGRVTIDAIQPSETVRSTTLRRSPEVAIELKRVVERLHDDLDEHHTHMSHLRREIANLDSAREGQDESLINDEAHEALRSTVRLVNQVMHAYDEIRRQTAFLKQTSEPSDHPSDASKEAPTALNESLTQMFAMQARYGLPLSIARVTLRELPSSETRMQTEATRQEALDQLVLIVEGLIRDTDIMHRDAEGTILVLLPNTQSDAATQFGHRLAAQVASDVGWTLCVGVAAAGDADDPQAIMSRSREAAEASQSQAEVVCFHDGEHIRPVPSVDHEISQLAFATATQTR